MAARHFRARSATRSRRGAEGLPRQINFFVGAARVEPPGRRSDDAVRCRPGLYRALLGSARGSGSFVAFGSTPPPVPATPRARVVVLILFGRLRRYLLLTRFFSVLQPVWASHSNARQGPARVSAI
jgi:hypothetical protein